MGTNAHNVRKIQKEESKEVINSDFYVYILNLIIFKLVIYKNLNHIYEGQDSNALTPYIFILIFNFQT